MMTEVMLTTGAIRHAKLQSNRHHQQQQTNTQLSIDRMPFLLPNQQSQSIIVRYKRGGSGRYFFSPKLSAV